MRKIKKRKLDNKHESMVINVGSGSLVIIKSPISGDGKVIYSEMLDKHDCAHKPLTEEALKTKVDSIRNRIDKDRYWFPVCKYMMWEGMVAEGDFNAAREIIQRLFNADINPKDLSINMNVMSFRKSLQEWSMSDAPVSGSTFNKYKSIAEALYSL